MGGVYTKSLKGCVTHLVTNTVMSAKYEVNHFAYFYFTKQNLKKRTKEVNIKLNKNSF